uniref:Uncharacterized protein n=1 Tax=Candidatus Kentrum sp. DK TaxID=2126562 RepID=A0A450SYR1_9GAMM|nr:MAG: hypothetical protein BECKDK2373B_GA0170837_108218 [Candidatus Kentron sp. DK]
MTVFPFFGVMELFFLDVSPGRLVNRIGSRILSAIPGDNTIPENSAWSAVWPPNNAVMGCSRIERGNGKSRIVFHNKAKMTEKAEFTLRF